ncbi:hypothetical protein ES319_A11G041200v1 [Gossypium barbadense]|uniref:Uncharacterized protein n=1 Tax=Gossypium barbadense TaxID=3634 RepID=A0A5J5TIH1_GOSBA|nr:hypothetical protein ES319_A11G041200v1 [Gossypium barbadense]
MATSAFKSTSKRSSLGDSADVSSSNRASVHRRARSLSRFSRRLADDDDDDDDETTPAPKTRGRTVNTARGSGLPEISLDDLAIELFDSSLRGRSASWNANVSPRNGEGGVIENVVQRRGRSVSRRGTSGSSVNSGSGGRLTSDTANSRRRRSVSVARYQISDSESDLDHPQNSSNRASMRSSIGENYQISSTHKPTASNRQGLRRSLSQKDLKYHDGYSNHTSAITDDDRGDALSNKSGMERIIRAVYAQKKGEAHPTGDNVNGGLYAAMRKELRHAVEEIKTQLEQAMVKTKMSNIASDGSLHLDNSDFLQAVSTIRRKCITKLEKTEKRRQDLSAEILLEKHGRELSKIVKELLSEPKNSIVEKSFRARKKSHDQNTMSKQLTKEAERYIEDFISNVEDTDISSLDGDRSDTNSSIWGITKTPNFQSPAVFKSVPVEMDGVMLPWLQWETSNDASPSLFENKPDLSQEAPSIQDLSNQFRSSNGSWSPAFSDCPSVSIGEDRGTKFGEQGRYHNQSQSSSIGAKTSQFDVSDYLNTKGNEAFLHEIWCQRRRISSGGLLLCNHIMF